MTVANIQKWNQMHIWILYILMEFLIIMITCVKFESEVRKKKIIYVNMEINLNCFYLFMHSIPSTPTYHPFYPDEWWRNKLAVDYGYIFYNNIPFAISKIKQKHNNILKTNRKLNISTTDQTETTLNIKKQLIFKSIVVFLN